MPAVPKSPGSRVVDQRPSLVRVIRTLQADLQRLRNITRPETLTFIPSDPTRWEPAVSATMANALETLVYRSGSRLFCDVACGTGAASVLSVQFAVPDLAVTGTAATTASGGTQQIVRITLDLPDSWDSGAAHLTYIQAMRVSGTDATTVRALRSWQR